MKLVAYMRVSTDDKGQDPERQREPILRRCAQDGHEVVAWVVDEKPNGRSSAGIPAMEREGVQEAIRAAREHKADGIIVESVDRWTRCGWQDVGVSLYLLRSELDLQLLFADVTGDDFVVELLVGIMATVAKLTRRRLSEATKSGMARRKALGVKMGRPKKPGLTNAELAISFRMREAGAGLRLIALELTRQRGAHEVADPKAQRRRTVTPTWLHVQLEAHQKSGTIGAGGSTPPAVPAPKTAHSGEDQ